MREVVLQIPSFEAEQNIDIDVKINGKKRTMHYRVEIIEWEDYDGKSADKVEVIKKVIKEHDKDWQLVQIGIPTDRNIPIMFRKKTVKPPKSKNVLSPQEKLKAMLEARDSLNERENDITIQILLGPPQQ